MLVVMRIKKSIFNHLSGTTNIILTYLQSKTYYEYKHF